jgi:hypothetical protein
MPSEEGSEDYEDEGSAGTLSEDDGLVDYGGFWPPTYGYSSDDERFNDVYGRDYGSGASDDNDEQDSSSHAWTSSEYEEGSTVSRLEDPHEDLHRRGALPYCQRCNKEFQSEGGLHCHRRMSRFHPFYCGRCRIDFEREQEFEVCIYTSLYSADLIFLQSHNASAHGPISFTRMITSTLSPIIATRTQNPPRPPPQAQEPINPRAAMAARIAEATARRATITAADTSSSTIRPPTLSPTTPVASASNKAPTQSTSNTVSSPPAATASKLTLTCPLCLENVDGMTTTLCGHVFCKEVCSYSNCYEMRCPNLFYQVHHCCRSPQARMPSVSCIRSFRKSARNLPQRGLIVWLHRPALFICFIELARRSSSSNCSHGFVIISTDFIIDTAFPIQLSSLSTFLNSVCKCCIQKIIIIFDHQISRSSVAH